MTQPPRNVLVFGASGQIGSALMARLSRSRGAASVEPFAWQEVATGGLDQIAVGAADFVFANGLTDPHRNAEELLDANLRLPQAVVRWSVSQGRVADRFLTLGTMLERFPDLGRANVYIASKLALAEWMGRQDRSRFAHVRLHTVYGGPVKPHMFLGQMAAALGKNEKFSMSSGDQLREYHRVEDVARFLDELLLRAEFDGPIIELSSGRPVRLADLARGVFRAFDREKLLDIGGLPLPADENINRRFAPSPRWFDLNSRDTIDDVTRFLKNGIRGR